MFSFIIVSYNTKDYLNKCLDNLRRAALGASLDFEIIIVDNNSIDGTKEFLSSLPDKVILNNENLGFAKACNHGASFARGDIIMFINSDIEMTVNVLREINNYFLNNKKTGIVAPILFDQNKSPEAFSGGNFPNFKRLFSRSVGLKNLGTIKEPLVIDWVSGAALAIRKELFKVARGFDENFFMYFEDVDLCLRTKVLGYDTILLGSTRLLHYRGQSLANEKMRKKYYYNSQNYYFKKHFGIFAVFILKIIRGIYLIKNS